MPNTPSTRVRDWPPFCDCGRVSPVETPPSRWFPIDRGKHTQPGMPGSGTCDSVTGSEAGAWFRIPFGIRPARGWSGILHSERLPFRRNNHISKPRHRVNTAAKQSGKRPSRRIKTQQCSRASRFGLICIAIRTTFSNLTKGRTCWTSKPFQAFRGSRPSRPRFATMNDWRA